MPFTTPTCSAKVALAGTGASQSMKSTETNVPNQSPAMLPNGGAVGLGVGAEGVAVAVGGTGVGVRAEGVAVTVEGTRVGVDAEGVDVTLGGIGVGLGMGPEMVSESLQPDPRAVETATEKSNLGMLTRACAKQLVESSTGSDCVVTGIIVSSLARARRGPVRGIREFVKIKTVLEA